MISVWTDKSGELGEAGRIYVIDGHNRIDLAKRSGAPEVNVQMIEALNVEDAKAEAAIININQLNFTQQGAIAPIDAAKVIKARGLKPLIEMGMNPKKKLVIQGRQLARLPDFMFSKLISGDIGLEKALAYGSEKISPTAIGDVYKSIDKKNPSIDTIKEAIQMAREATEVVPQEGDGFLPTMAQYFKSTNTQNLLKIRSQIRSQLRKKLTTLKNVGTLDKKAGVETVAGNRINLENTQNAVLEASQAVDLFNAVAASGGETTQIIKELAGLIEKKGNPAKIVADNLDRIQDAMQMEGSPLFKGSEVVEIAQEVDKEHLAKQQLIVNERNKTTFNDQDIQGLKNEPKFKEATESLSEDQQLNIEKQLKNKGKVTNNPSNIDGKALPPLVTNPKARVFPYLFEETMGIKPRDSVIAERLQNRKTVSELSNFELEDAVKRTEKYKLTNQQIKNIQAKRSKYEKAEAIEKELDKQLMEMMEGKGVQGKLFKEDFSGKGEAAFEKLLAARDKAREEAAKFVDNRLELHNGHMNAKNELENRKRSPEKYNEKEKEIVKEVEAEQRKEELELKEKIEYHKDNAENGFGMAKYRTVKGYVLTEPHHIDNFTFATYGAQLEGLVDGKGGRYSKFYFGKPAPRYNNEVINFVSDLDIAIYTVAKQIANGTSKKVNHILSMLIY